MGRNWSRPLLSKDLSDKRSKLSTFSRSCVLLENVVTALFGQQHKAALGHSADSCRPILLGESIVASSLNVPDGLEKLHGTEEEDMSSHTTAPCRLEKYHTFLRLSPHLSNKGVNNTYLIRTVTGISLYSRSSLYS